MDAAAVRKLFKCAAGVLNSAFGADEAKKCEAEVKEILGDEFVECSFESVLLALSKAIEKGLVPEPGLQTLRNLEPHFEKNGLSPSSPLCVALGLHATLKINVVTMAGEKTAHEVESKGKILGLKCKLGVPFGTKANLTFKDTLLQDSQTFADAGVEEGSDLLLDDEEVEAIVFGDWGWGNYEEVDEAHQIPEHRRGKVLTPYEAGSYMEGWSFLGGHGAPECYAAYIYTNQRVIFVCQYDGLTSLEGIPKSPIACMPTMPGG
eukprot:s306_g5.t1